MTKFKAGDLIMFIDSHARKRAGIYIALKDFEDYHYPTKYYCFNTKKVQWIQTGLLTKYDDNNTRVGKIYYDKDQPEDKVLALESSVRGEVLVYWYGWNDIQSYGIECLKEYKCKRK